MEEELNTSMNIETDIYKKCKQYLKDKSKFLPNVFNATPKNLTMFPTVTIVETNNVQNTRATTLNRLETVNDLTYTIEIYAKDMVLEGVRYSSKEVTDELKFLIIDFFQMWGFTRTLCSKADYLNYEVSRFIIRETCSVNSWNRKINM